MTSKVIINCNIQNTGIFTFIFFKVVRVHHGVKDPRSISLARVDNLTHTLHCSLYSRYTTSLLIFYWLVHWLTNPLTDLALLPWWQKSWISGRFVSWEHLDQGPNEPQQLSSLLPCPACWLTPLGLLILILLPVILKKVYINSYVSINSSENIYIYISVY